MLTRLRQMRATDDDGMTLAELLVGMTLLSIVSAVALGFFVGTSAEASRTTNQTLNGAGVRVAMNQVAQMLRYADTPTSEPGYSTGRFVTITASEVTFYSNIASGARTGTANRIPPTKVDLAVTNGRLVEKLYPPITAYTSYPANYNYVTNYSSTPSTTMTLLPKVSSSSVFTYCTSATDPSVSCTPATTTDQVSAVIVKLTVPGLSGESDESLQSTVAITGAVS